jgi:chromosome segregation ATPase
LEDRRTERARIEKQVDDLQKQIIAKESEVLKTESRIEYINHQAENDRNELQILNTNQTNVNEFIGQADIKDRRNPGSDLKTANRDDCQPKGTRRNPRAAQ